MSRNKFPMQGPQFSLRHTGAAGRAAVSGKPFPVADEAAAIAPCGLGHERSVNTKKPADRKLKLPASAAPLFQNPLARQLRVPDAAQLSQFCAVMQPIDAGLHVS